MRADIRQNSGEVEVEVFNPIEKQVEDALERINQERDRNLTSRLNKRIKQVIVTILRTIFVIGVSYIILQPLFQKIATAFMAEIDLFDPTVEWIPRNFTFNNIKIVWEHMNYPIAFLNTFVLTFSVSFLQLLSCTLVAYGIGRFRFKGGNILFALVIFTLVVPPQMIMSPLSLNFRYFNLFGLISEQNLLGSFWPYILTSSTAVGLRNGLFIYIMRQFFRGMPKDLEEAAYLDGAGIFRTFRTIMLPGAVPGMVVIFLFAFVWQWNDFFFNTIFLSGQGNFLLQALQGVALKALDHDHNLLGTPYASLIQNTGMLLYIAPLLILYAFMQKYFIESIQRTGIVG